MNSEIFSHCDRNSSHNVKNKSEERGLYRIVQTLRNQIGLISVIITNQKSDEHHINISTGEGLSNIISSNSDNQKK